MAHSPAPWKFGVHGWDESGKQSFTEKPLSYSGPGYYENPSIFAADGAEVVGCDEYDVFSGLDNKRLICAAPDLLSACIQSRAVFNTMLGDECDLPVTIQDNRKINVLRAKIETLSAAIARAKAGEV